VDDRLAVDVIKVCQDPLFEFGFGCDPYVTQHGAGHLREEAFHQIQPRAVFRGKHQGEASLWPGRQPSVGFLRNMGGVIIQDQLDGGIRGISCIEQFEEADEFARPMALLDTRMHRTGEQIDPGERAECPMTLVFMVASEGVMFARLWWQVGCGIADRLDARLFVAGDGC
jgi:hypothetical protein